MYSVLHILMFITGLLLFAAAIGCFERKRYTGSAILFILFTPTVYFFFYECLIFFSIFLLFGFIYWFAYRDIEPFDDFFDD